MRDREAESDRDRIEPAVLEHCAKVGLDCAPHFCIRKATRAAELSSDSQGVEERECTLCWFLSPTTAGAGRGHSRF